jgi:hypothetical protein
MSAGRFLVRTIAVASAMFALGFVGHQLLLGRDYASIEPIMRDRADMQAHMPFALVNCLIFSSAFVWIYSHLRSAGAWLGQGIRFGLAIWAVAYVLLYLTNYVIEPWPGSFVAKILAWELLAAVVLGVLMAALAKNDLDALSGGTA